MTGQGERIELRIDEIAAGGDGVGRDTDGRVTFVPRAAPGDLLEVELVQVRKDFARGRVVSVVQASKHRIEAPCRYFAKGRCGGCQWQHISMDEQRRSKLAIAKRALRKLVDAGLELGPLLTPVADYHWRRRARLHWFRAPAATRAEIGFFAPKSQFVSDVGECLQLSEQLSSALAATRSALGPSLHGRGTLHLLEGTEGAHVAIEGACRPGAAESLASAAGIAGVRLNDRVFGAESVTIDGAGASADDFAQASDAGNQAIRQLVAQLSGPWRQGARVLELYAGAGNLTSALAGARVTAVERQPQRHTGAEVEWRVGDAAEVTAALATAGERFEGVVLDPPRQGAKDAMPEVVRLAPAHVVYVSCNPATLARDAQVLAEAGYRPTQGQVVDSMPQTSHLEVIVAFERGS
ncbi:MAG: TRAM domain-containing protein [Deltaproteobacteria bacterium]|nr:TRAM domain-containing protein [Deltaproteobacteria bacterium]